MPAEILHPDSRGRISLAKFGGKPHQTYRVTSYEDGRIVLEPVMVLTERELADLKEGLAQSARGETVSLGTFVKTPPVEVRPLREGQPHEFEASSESTHIAPECAVCGQPERTRIHVVKEDGLQVPMRMLKELAMATGMPGYISAPKEALVDWLWTYNPWKLADAIRGSQA